MTENLHPQLYNIKTVLIVGLGLIGGSYAKALKNLNLTVYGTDIDKNTINFAINNNIVDDGATSAKNYLYDADLIILCLYPDNCLKWVEENILYFKPNVLITDVCGVKGQISETIPQFIEKYNQNKHKQIEFLPSHPMAGKEVSGIFNCDDKIFKNANFIICPNQNNTIKAIETLKDLANKIGFKQISILSAKEHDEMIGYVSQLTHAIAVALMLANDNENLSKYTGDSFRDLTRIAKINEKLWSGLFIGNKNILCDEIDNFISSLENIKQKIKISDDEGLKNLFIQSTLRRKHFDE